MPREVIVRIEESDACKASSKAPALLNRSNVDSFTNSYFPLFL